MLSCDASALIALKPVSPAVSPSCIVEQETQPLLVNVREMTVLRLQTAVASNVVVVQKTRRAESISVSVCSSDVQPVLVTLCTGW